MRRTSLIGCTHTQRQTNVHEAYTWEWKKWISGFCHAVFGELRIRELLRPSGCYHDPDTGKSNMILAVRIHGRHETSRLPPIATAW